MNSLAAKTWRLLDTGLRRAGENIALNRTLLESHQAGHSPNTLRFLRFYPSALAGYHQDIDAVIHQDYCRQRGIEIQRRITGGGAIYFHEMQLGWELYLHKKVFNSGDMQHISQRICEAAAGALRSLGVEAHFRPRNDIEVGGRKISGTGGAFDGDSLLYQGTLLISFDAGEMLKILRVPQAKNAHRAIKSIQERIITMEEILTTVPDFPMIQNAFRHSFAQAFGVKFASAQLNEYEQQQYAIILNEIHDPQWVYLVQKPRLLPDAKHGFYRATGGMIHVDLSLSGDGQHVEQIWISGDFFVHPKRIIADLESHLKAVPLKKLGPAIRQFFDQTPVDLLLLEPDDFVKAVDNALTVMPAEINP